MPHQSAWRKWASWCCERDVNPFTSNLIEILNFLVFLYEKGYEYSSINSHRSAISAYHVHIDNNPIGQHPRVCTLMTGIFNNRPPKPRYTFVWDIETVLNYLSKLPDNLNLPIRVLSHKLALLLALTAASRVSEICCLNTEYMVEFEDKYVFKFHKLTKSWRKGRPPLSVEFCAYQQNPKLCVVQAIKSYLQVTQAWRNKNGQKQLLLSTLAPHQEVKKSTAAGWVKAILGSAGIDTNLFTAHSTRAASTSKAKVKGLSLEDILKRGNWSNKSTWQKHHHKFVSNESTQLRKSIGLGSL